MLLELAEDGELGMRELDVLSRVDGAGMPVVVRGSGATAALHHVAGGSVDAVASARSRIIAGDCVGERRAALDATVTIIVR